MTGQLNLEFAGLPRCDICDARLGMEKDAYYIHVYLRHLPKIDPEERDNSVKGYIRRCWCGKHVFESIYGNSRFREHLRLAHPGQTCLALHHAYLLGVEP